MKLLGKTFKLKDKQVGKLEEAREKVSKDKELGKIQ